MIENAPTICGLKGRSASPGKPTNTKPRFRRGQPQVQLLYLQAACSLKIFKMASFRAIL